MKYQDEDWLRKKYHEEGNSTSEIADLTEVTRSTILRWMDKFDIERRGHGTPQKEGRYKIEAWLREQYIERRRSIRDIAEECGVSKATPRHWLHKFDIKIRQGSEAIETQWEDNEERREKQAEFMRNLEKPHVKRGHHTQETKEKMSEGNSGESNGMFGVTGEENPAWKENTPSHRFYQRKRWKQARQKALERDGYECTKCGSKDDLLVHHIEPLPDGAEFDLENLSTLCISCHGSIHPL